MLHRTMAANKRRCADWYSARPILPGGAMPARSIHTLYPRHAKTKQRDWKLAAFGGGCSLLGAACLLLAACSTQPAKPQNPAPPPLATPSPDAVAAGLPTVAPAAAP